MASEDLERKLEAIRELKQDYDIGTQDAFNYLKSQNGYFQLREEVNRELRKEGVNYRPTLREITNTCEGISIVADSVLSAAESNHALKQGFIGGGGLLYIPFYNEKFRKHDLNAVDISWDYTSFLIDLYKEADRSGSLIKAKMQILNGIIDNKRPYFIISGKKMSLKDVFENVELHFCLSIEDAPNEDGLTREEYVRSLVNDSISEMECEFSLFVRSNVHDTTYSEIEHLFPLVFERAQKEQTLHRLDTERRMALNAVRRLSKDILSSDCPVSQSIFYWQDRLKRRQEQLKELKDLKAPNIMLKKAQDYRDEAVYTIVALKKNGPWLKRYLNS